MAKSAPTPRQCEIGVNVLSGLQGPHYGLSIPMLLRMTQCDALGSSADYRAGLEYCVEQGALRQNLTRQRFPLHDGMVAVPEEPGLGVDIDEEVLEKYLVRS